MSTKNNIYEIGQWVHFDEGLGQVLYVRPTYVEKYTTEYFEGKKPGQFIDNILVIKLLCDHEGKIRKRNRIVAPYSEYCSKPSSKYMKLVSTIKKEQTEQYEKYITYDEKADIGGSVSMEFTLSQDELSTVVNEIDNLIENLPSFFTFKEFLKISKDTGLSLDFNDCKPYIPGTGINLTLNFFCRLYKTTNKERVYTKLWYSTN